MSDIYKLVAIAAKLTEINNLKKYNMKIIQIVVLLFFANMFSQEQKDLYILYNDENLKNRIVSTESLEVFQLELKDKTDIEHVLGFNKSGNVEVQTLIPGEATPFFKFTYSNLKGENPKKIVSGRQVKDALDFTEMSLVTDADNFYNTLSLFENIYFVYVNGDTSKLLAKKVKFERIGGL